MEQKKFKETPVAQYIQFSKKVTRWGMLLSSLLLLCALIAIACFNLPKDSIVIIGKLYTSYATIMGIIIGVYQGNSTIEKWSKAKYQTSQINNQSKE